LQPFIRLLVISRAPLSLARRRHLSRRITRLQLLRWLEEEREILSLVHVLLLTTEFSSLMKHLNALLEFLIHFASP
jgi:hypothetical protein